MNAKKGPMLRLLLPLCAAGGIGFILAGCGRDSGSPKIKICYLGLTCEPPIFVAYEKGFFEEEGLDVELIKSSWDSMRDGLHLGTFQATHHLVMYMMQPMEVGLDVKLTGGIHTGCLRLQAGKKTGIKAAAQLKGKKIGITHLGSPPFLFASRVLAAHGLDPKKDVEWVTFPGDAMSLALDQERVDAVASAEPIGTMLIATDKVDVVSDQAITPPYDDEYCCAVVVNGKFVREHPVEAGKVTRALLKGAKWVHVNPVAAAKLAVEKKYVSATAEINAQAIRALKYEPGVSKAKANIRTIALELKKSGFLRATTDPEELAKKAWLDLPGVTDEWVKGLKVEKVAGGGPIPKLSGAAFAAIFESGPMCDDGGGCMGCCDELGRGLLPLPGAWALVRPTRLDRKLKPEGGMILASPFVEAAPASAGPKNSKTDPSSAPDQLGARGWTAALAPVVAASLALVAHELLPNRQIDLPTRLYPLLLKVFLGVAALLALAQWAWRPLRPGVRQYGPLLAFAAGWLGIWDLFTLKLAWVRLPHFPGPDMVLQGIWSDGALLIQCTYESLLRLLAGYLGGVLLGLTAGVLMGWFRGVRYWGVPVMKLAGPIPATALIPTVMVLFPNNPFLPGVSLIAFAVSFPVTMLTMSGIINVPASYFDVARTLGAGRGYLIFRVAIPAALPSIFIGLFMGLLASFLVLVVAEAVGVKNGLGWYVEWRRSAAEYDRVLGALFIMCLFFSGILTVLFKIRDRVLGWQKGVIRW